MTIGFEAALWAVLPGRHRSARFISVALIIIVLFAAALFVPFQRKLLVIEMNTGRILYHTNVKPGDTFSISYTHSINKSPVDDILEIQRDYSLLLKKTIFRAFGVGIPSELENDQKMTVYADRTEIDNINRQIKECLVFVGVVADHRFRVHDDLIHLNHLTKPQRTVKFEVGKVSVFTLMRGYKNVR